MNNLTFNNGAYKLEKANGEVYEGVVSNLVAHFLTDTITITDRVTLVKLPIITAQSNDLQIGGQTKTFEQIKTIIETELAKGGGASSADAVSYDNTTSGLQSTNVQDAIDEVGANLGEIGTQVQGHETALHNIPTLTESDWETLRTAGGVQSEISEIKQTNTNEVLNFPKYLTICKDKSLSGGSDVLVGTILFEQGHTYITTFNRGLSTKTSYIFYRNQSGTNITSISIGEGLGERIHTYAYSGETQLVNVYIRPNNTTTYSLYVSDKYDGLGNIIDYNNIMSNNAINNKFTDGNRFIAHLLPKGNNTIIPSESIHEPSFLRRLGFKYVEIHVHKTSDGVFVLTHGDGTKLGNDVEDNNGNTPTNVTFASLTYEQLSTQYHFKSKYAKYRTPIPRLEDYLKECLRNNISVYINNDGGGGELTITQKILGGRNWIQSKGSRRDDVTYANAYTSIAGLKSAIDANNRNFIGQISQQLFPTLTDTEVSELSEYAHAKGRLLGCVNVYTDRTNEIRALMNGVDVLLSYGACNFFDNGNYKNLSSFSDFATTGTITEDKTLLLTDGQEVSFVGDFADLAKAQLFVNYNGTLIFNMGTISNLTFTSDGTKTVPMSTIYQETQVSVSIKSVGNTTINDIQFNASKC